MIMNDPAQISPYQTVTDRRQSSGARDRRPKSKKPAIAKASASPAAPARKRKSWPILEVVLTLLLIKIMVGGLYLVFRPAEGPNEKDIAAAVADLTAGSEAAPAPVAPSAPVAAPAPVTPPAAPVPASPTPVVAEAAPAALPARASSVVDDYLAVVSPSVAEAQVPLSVPASSLSAVSAGALMVIGQAATGSVAGGSDAIPLPPGADDLLAPTAPRSASPAPAPAAQPAAAPAAAPLATAPMDDAEQARLRARERDLARREALLNTRSDALSSLETELNNRLAAIEASRSEMEGLISRNQAILDEQKALREQQQKDDAVLKDARIQHLVTALGGMKPEQAGTLVTNLDDDVAVAVMSAMSGRKAGLILAFVEPVKAARLVKAISEMRIDPNLLAEDAAAPAQ